MKILYFLKNGVCTPADKEKAVKLGHPVQFRNTAYITKSIENCDGVAGDVPEIYKEMPTAEEAIEDYNANLESLYGMVGKPKTPKTLKTPKEDPPKAPIIKDKEPPIIDETLTI